MTAKVGSLNVDLTLETARFQRGLSQAQRGLSNAQKDMNGLGSTLGGLSKQMASVGAIIGGSALVGGLAQAAVNGLKYASSLGEVAKQLGVTTAELQEYRYAATQTGIEQGEMDKALAKLTRTVGEAAKGSGAGAKAFKELGINIRDTNGNLKSAGQLIPEIAGALQKVPSEAEQARLKVQLFGRAGQQLGPLLAEGAKGINNLRTSARDMGLVLDEKLIANADAAADKLSTLQQVLQMKLTAAVAENASEIDALATSLLNLVTQAGAAVKAWRLWKNELAIRMNENTANGWFTSPAEKAAAEARIRQLRGERQEIQYPGTRVLMPGGGMVKPPAGGSNGKFGAPLILGPSPSWTGRPGAPSALKRSANYGGGSSFRSSFQKAIDAAGTGTDNWYEQGRRLAIDIGMDSGIGEKILSDMEKMADKAETTKVEVVRSFKDMADGTISALRNLSDSLRGGGFLDILGAVIGLATQLASIGVFGKKAATNVNKIPAYANGTSFHPGGLALVGERGPELLHLPRGSAVTPNNRMGGGNTYILNGNLMTPEFWRQINEGDMAAADAGGRIGQRRTAYRQSRRLA